MRPAISSRRAAAHAEPLDSRTAGSRPGRPSNRRSARSGDGSGSRTARGSGGSRAQVLGLVGAQPVRLAVGHEAGDRLAQAERAEGEAGRAADGRQALGPALVEPDDGGAQRAPVRRRSPRPCLRWVVIGEPGDRVATDRGIARGPAGRPRRACASRARGPAPPSPAGARRTARSGSGPTRREPPRSNTSARTLCVPTSIARICSRAAHRGPSSSRTPALISPSGSNSCDERLDRAHPQRALLGGEVRGVVGPDPVLVADRRAVADDHVARRRLQGPPALERLVRVVGQTEDVGRVQARAARVGVRQVAEGVDPLAGRVEAVAEGPAELGGEAGQVRPVGRGLERVDGVAFVPQRVAQVRRREPRPPPGRADARCRRHRARRGPGRPPPGRSAPTTSGMAAQPDDHQAAVRPLPAPARGSVGAGRCRGDRRRGRTSWRSRAGSRRGPSTAAGPTGRADGRARAPGPSRGRRRR